MEKEIFNLYLEDMVVNAFIEINSVSRKKINEISLQTIELYGTFVAKKLEEENAKVVYCLSRELTENFRVIHGDLFTLKDSSVILNDGVKVETLIEKFRGNLPLKLLLAYMDKKVVEKGLLEPMSLLIKENRQEQKSALKILNMELKQREYLVAQDEIEKQIRNLEEREIIKRYLSLINELRKTTTQMESNEKIINYLDNNQCNHNGILLSLGDDELYECICLNCGRIIEVDLNKVNPYDILKLDIEYDEIIKLAPQIIESYHQLNKENNSKLDIIKKYRKNYEKN